MLGTLMWMGRIGIGMRLGAPQATPITTNFPDADGLAGMIARLGSKAVDGIQSTFILLFALLTLRFLVRRNWIAYVLFVPLVMFTNPFENSTGTPEASRCARMAPTSGSTRRPWSV